jgi:hypothetical protein
MSVADSGILFAGDLQLNQLVAGVYTGLVDLNGAKLETKYNSEIIDQLSKGRDLYGQVLDTAIIPKPAELTIEFSPRSPKSLAMAIQGSASAFSQGSGTVTDQAAVANLGASIDLGFRNLTVAGLAVKNSAGTTTYVKDTDYGVDYVSGQIYIIPTGAITEAQALKISFGYSAVAADKVLGGTAPQVYGLIKMKGKNLFNQYYGDLTIWDARLASDSGVDWMSEKPVPITMKGRMVTPAGKTSPLELIYNQVLS